MTSQTRQKIITMQILPNISRSKGNQKMKFGHLIEYEKSCEMWWGSLGLGT